MATAQVPGRSRLADDAATAALYVTHPERQASLRASTAPNNRFYDTPNLSHASAASALAHANRKPVEIWQPPARLPAAEQAALCVKDFTPPQQPKPTTEHSAEGLGAALLAVRDQKQAPAKTPKPSHKRGISADQHRNTYVGGDPKEKALQAATDAYTTSRKRADSVPSDTGVSSDQHHARSAAGASRYVQPEQEAPLAHLDSAAEASRIHNIANANAKMYTSAPPVQARVEEQNYRNSLRAASVSMAKDMYKVTEAKESGASNSAVQAAQKGQSQLGYRKTVSTADGSAVRRAIALQEAAQKRANEKLALMQDENAEYQQYYGTAPQPQRSRLSRRKRTSSDADASQIDAEQSRQIRNQMTSLRTKLDQVDGRRTKDRELLMQAARRNVDQTLQDMEAKVYASTGRAPPSVQRDWDEIAQERVRREAETLEASTIQGDRVKIGSQQYMDYADVEAVARSRLQPALDEITEDAEQQRARDVEARLDAEQEQRHAAVERQREAEVRELEKQDKSTKHKSEGKVTIPKFFLWRKKSKRARVEQSETEDAQAVSPVAQGAAEAHEQPAAAENDVSKDAISEEHSSDPEVAEAAAPVAVAPSTDPIAVSEPNEEPTRVPTQEIQEATQEPTDSSIDDIPRAIPRRQSAPQTRDAAGTGPAMIHHFTPPVSSPRADSKLKTWFRDRLVRRSSGPVPVYPHQPGPDFSESEPAFQGGASLTGREEPRNAALSSHPPNGSDSHPTHNRSSSYYSVESNSASQKKSGKRNRLRRTFLKTASKSDDEPMESGEADKRRDSGVPSSDSKGTDIHSLKNSAVEQGLPAPPTIGENASLRRESRFSEDL